MHLSSERGWWKDPEVVQKLHLSDDQVRKLDKIDQDHQIQEIGLRADLEKQDAALRSQMETDPPDEAQVLDADRQGNPGTSQAGKVPCGNVAGRSACLDGRTGAKAS